MRRSGISVAVLNCLVYFTSCILGRLITYYVWPSNKQLAVFSELNLKVDVFEAIIRCCLRAICIERESFAPQILLRHKRPSQTRLTV